MPIVQLNNINKSFGKKEVLNNVSICIETGSMTALTGASGTGKTTLLNIIGLIEEYNSGSLVVCGKKNVKPNSKEATLLMRSKISYLFQNFALIDTENVEENLKIGLKYLNLTRKEEKNRIKVALNSVDLKGFEKRKVFELSGGEQQRIAVARILLKPSEIILADEPTGSLDQTNRDIILGLLQKLKKEGKTIIIVTHDPYVANYCDVHISL